MATTVELQIASNSDKIPDPNKFQRWVAEATQHLHKDAEVSLRIVNQDESRELNHQYRGKNKPTNVLSFPSDLPSELNLSLLGDLVICAPIVEQEALEQHKNLEAHWAHMTVHGTLHLLGYDHINEIMAEEMENLETLILTNLNYSPPYQQC